jgi:2-haloacid dehalogenase
MAERLRACVFDAYGTLLDVNSPVAREAASVGSPGEALSLLWRQRQLEYTWTRSLMNRYADFWRVTEEALDYALEAFDLTNRPGLKQALLNSYLELPAYPDVKGALQSVKSIGLRAAVLSNGTVHMLRAALEANGLSQFIDPCLSVDEPRIYKPDPRVYQFACDTLDLPAEQICFLSANAWDLAGAASCGLRAVGINRKKQPREYSFVSLYAELPSLEGLADLLRLRV